MAHISLKGSDAGWDCAEDDTILRAALRAGLGFPYECNVGSCGNCRCELVEGEVRNLRPDAPGLNERDRAKGRILACQAVPVGDCTVKLRFDPRYVSTHRPEKREGTLIAIRDLTHDIREFRFRLNAPMPFLAGQYALLTLPGVEGARAYSMANTGEEGVEWHFQIRRVAGGAATSTLFDRLEIGAKIGIDGPYGMAWLRQDAPRDLVLLAGGSGLSPMVSIARAAAVAPALAGQRIDFFYGGRSSADLCGQDMLAELEGFGTRIHYHAAVSGEDADWQGYRGFVHDLAASVTGARLAECEIYFAGPPAMGEALQRMFLEAGVPADRIHFDQFF